MRNIYKGTVRKLSVKNLRINDGLISSIDFDSIVIKDDVLFYLGVLNNFICFEEGTVLLDSDEAMDILINYINSCIAQKREISPDVFCTYYNPDEVKFSRRVSNQEFKSIKRKIKSKQKSN